MPNGIRKKTTSGRWSVADLCRRASSFDGFYMEDRSVNKRHRTLNSGKKNYIINSYFIGGNKIDEVLMRTAIFESQEEIRMISNQELGVCDQGGNP